MGNVSSTKQVKTKLAEVVLEQVRSDLKGMLSYKAIGCCGIFLEVDEANTTRTCSCRGSCTGPKGIAGRGIREWVCEECRTMVDRDLNSLLNILRLGHETLAGGNLTL